MVKIILTIDDSNKKNASELEKLLKSNPSIKKIQYVEEKKSKAATSLDRGLKQLKKALAGELETKSLNQLLNEN